MISYEEFGAMRLSQFAAGDEIAPLDNWEFMDELWIGEAIGFSEWLRPKGNPNVLQSLALELDSLPETLTATVMEKIKLPLQSGMDIERLVAILGKPERSRAFVKNRKSYEFVFGSPFSYQISCTVLNDGGLIYLVVMVPNDDSR